MNPDLSVLWREHLEAHGSDADDLLRSNQSYPVIFEANVDEIRAIRTDSGDRLYVVYTPIDEAPEGCAHSSVLYFSTGRSKEEKEATKTNLSETFHHRYGTLTLEVPEGL
jgi:hypothetical protein